MTTIYETQAEKLANGGEWLKLGVGVHKVTFLEDISQPVKIKKVILGKEKEVEQCDVLVDYLGGRKKWSLTVGTSTKSVWGQLMLLGKHYKTLIGKTFTILVKTSKDKNGEDRKDYSIVECAELLQKQQGLVSG